MWTVQARVEHDTYPTGRHVILRNEESPRSHLEIGIAGLHHAVTRSVSISRYTTTPERSWQDGRHDLRIQFWLQSVFLERTLGSGRITMRMTWSDSRGSWGKSPDRPVPDTNNLYDLYATAKFAWKSKFAAPVIDRLEEYGIEPVNQLLHGWIPTWIDGRPLHEETPL
jgi:hypothetical protein